MAVEIIKTDGESYVRASALTFIATMVRINKLWERQLSQVDLTVRIFISSLFTFRISLKKMSYMNKLIFTGNGGLSTQERE